MCTTVYFLLPWVGERCAQQGLPSPVGGRGVHNSVSLLPWVGERCAQQCFCSSRGWERGVHNSVIPLPWVGERCAQQC